MHLPGHDVHPQAEQESILGHFWGDLEVGVVDLVLLDRLLRPTTKKVHPRQNPGYVYVSNTFLLSKLQKQ